MLSIKKYELFPPMLSMGLGINHPSQYNQYSIIAKMRVFIPSYDEPFLLNVCERSLEMIEEELSKLQKTLQ